MKTWAVSDKWFEIQVAVIAETRSSAKTLAWHEFLYDDDWTDLRCSRVKSPIPVEGPERIINDVGESLQYGFRWNDETMDDAFPGWYGCWLWERSDRE